ncbi:MAG: DUF3142 domain-containing protein [Cyanobacteria bacterium SZAS LIN-3]|nr:DUF3142 domain-containing protein [Cyanobacteria bacterium SZAS LIN-3]
MPLAPAPSNKSPFRALVPTGPRSAGLALVLGAASAALLSLPLALSHTYLVPILRGTALGQFLEPHLMDGPRVVVWTWQHNDDLSFLNPARTGVAIFVGRLSCRDKSINFERNLCAVKLPEGIYREAAIRVELDQPDLTQSEALTDQLSDRIVALGLAGSRRVSAVQIDCDAGLNERQFYARLLHKVRAKLPPGVKLSMTALASWCLDDNWIRAAHLPVDEVVPMLFSMGIGREQVASRLSRRAALSPGTFAGRLAPGLSLQEPNSFSLLGARLSHYRRLYLFSSRGWNPRQFARATELLKTAGNQPQENRPAVISHVMR